MKPSINLATRRIIQKKTLRKFFLSSVIFFGTGVSLTLGLLLLNFFINLQISNLNDERASLQAEIVRQQATKDKLLIIQERLGQIRSLLTARSSAEEGINLFVSIIPESIEIKSIQYEPREMSFSLSSPSLLDLQKLIEEELPTIENGANRNISSITVGNFKLDSENLEYITSFVVAQSSAGSEKKPSAVIQNNE